jgi:parallel beta-helix repeat protein
VYKSTKLACSFPALPCFSNAALDLSRESGSTMNILSLDLQASNIQDNPDIKSVPNHSPIIAPFNRMKKMTVKLFFIVFIQGLLGIQQAYATTYYVSPSGVDSNSGTSLSAPVKTIKKALSKAYTSGDIVYVTTGTYAETVYIGQSGITLSAYGDNKPVIDGGSTLPNKDWGSMILVGGNYNTVSGFEAKNSNINGTYNGGWGLAITGHHNKASKMNVHHTWEHGVMVQGDYNIVEDSAIWQAARKNSANPGSVIWATGISAARNSSASALIPGITSYAIFRRNKVFNNWGEGLSCFEADHCTMEDNIVYDNWTVNLYLSDSTNSLVQRNIIYISSAPAIPTRNSLHTGISLADEVATVPRSANNTIINNFIYNAVFRAFAWTGVANSGLNNVLIANNTIVDGSLFTAVGGSPAVVNTNSQIRDNIILGKNSYVPSNSGITFSNNNWAMTPSLAAAVTDIAGDPQIARTGTTTPGTLTSAYFKLLGSSPVIDTATSLNTVVKDFFQAARGPDPDIGGHEFQ